MPTRTSFVKAATLLVTASGAAGTLTSELPQPTTAPVGNLPGVTGVNITGVEVGVQPFAPVRAYFTHCTGYSDYYEIDFFNAVPDFNDSFPDDFVIIDPVLTPFNSGQDEQIVLTGGQTFVWNITEPISGALGGTQVGTALFDMPVNASSTSVLDYKIIKDGGRLLYSTFAGDECRVVYNGIQLGT